MADNSLLLYGSVGASFWDEEHFTAREVVADLAGRSGPLTVRLNSGGGIAHEGQAIYTALRDYSAAKGPVHVVVDAVAMSAASLIAMAGDTRTMRDGSYLLIHDPAAGVTEGRGTEADHRKMAEMLGRVSDLYAGVYADRAGISREDARQIMREDTVMDGETAVLMGFATATEKARAVAAATFDYRIYATAPRGLRAASQSLGRPRGKSAVLAMIAGEPRPNLKEPSMADETTAAEDTPDSTEQAPKPTAYAIRMERERVKRIPEIVALAKLPAAEAAELTAEMIDGGTTIKAAQERIVTMLAEHPDNQGHHFHPSNEERGVGRSWDQGQGFRAKMVAGLSARLSGQADTPMAREAAKVDFPSLIMACARNAGLRPVNAADAISMAGFWTTTDFVSILDGALGADVARRVAEQPAALERAARVIDRPDYREQILLGTSRTTEPEEVPEGAEIKHVTLAETGENAIRLRDFGAIFAITRQAFVNDQNALGLLQDIELKMADGARRKKTRVLLEPVLANAGAGETMRDGKPMFHLDHGNLAPAAAQGPLSVNSLAAATLAMRRQKGPLGEVLPRTPRYLIVPPELEMLAKQLLASINAAKTADVNPISGTLELIVEDYLTNPTAWYLAADPALTDGLVLAFLNGQKAPRIESKVGWNTFSIEWRSDWPMDSAFTSTGAWYKNVGVVPV